MRTHQLTTDSQVSIYDSVGLDRLRCQLQIDPYLIRRLCTNLFKHWKSDEESLARLSNIDKLASHLQIHPLQLHQQADSQVDGATKLLFRTKQGLLLESVLLQAGTGRTTLCVSSQIGCAAACEFCATGKMKTVKNLTTGEILDQVLQAGRLANTRQQRVRNLVFMGMGEPFHNEENLYHALKLLLNPQYFHFGPSRLLISSVGIPAAMQRCATQFPRINQALSLHSVRQEVREQIIPLARRYSLEQLHQTVRIVNRIQAASGKPTVMLEYLMLQNINDSAQDANELIAWCRDLHVHLNLIPYNPIREAPQLTGTGPVHIQAFANLLKQAGLKTTTRRSLGNDIAAACGQLARAKPVETVHNS